MQKMNKWVAKLKRCTCRGAAPPVAPTKLWGKTVKGLENQEMNSLSHEMPTPSYHPLQCPRADKHSLHKKDRTNSLETQSYSSAQMADLLKLSTMVMEKSCSWTKIRNVYKHGTPSSPWVYCTHRASCVPCLSSRRPGLACVDSLIPA